MAKKAVFYLFVMFPSDVGEKKKTSTALKPSWAMDHLLNAAEGCFHSSFLSD